MIDLWVPPKPAIIRPAEKELRRNWLVDRKKSIEANFVPGWFPGIAAAAGTPLTTITQVLSATTGTAGQPSTITAPVGILSGDLIVMLDYCSDAGTGLVTPTGFTSIATSSANSQRMAFSYKRAVGTEGGTSITGMTVAAANGSGKLIYVFRGNAPAATITVSGAVGNQNTTGNPTAQTVSASGGVAPLVILGAYGAFSAISPRTFTVGGVGAKDGEINATSTSGIANEAHVWLAYKIYNSSPQNASIDMDDESAQILMSCYLQMAN